MDCDSLPVGNDPGSGVAERAMNIHKKICIIGEFGVGKTSLVARYVQSIFSDKYQTTVGVKIDKKEVLVGDQRVTLVLWDLAGESAAGGMKMMLIKGASGFLLVADGTRPDTLRTTVRLQQEVTGTLGQIPFILAINKADLTEDWAIGPADIEEYRAFGWDVRLASAKNGQGVDQIFTDLATRLIQPDGETSDQP
jgi:small GTP-binding protein